MVRVMIADAEYYYSDHATACKAVGKSCVLEEYGVGEKGSTRTSVINSWHDTIRSSGLAGDMYWQFVRLKFSNFHGRTTGN